MAQMQYLFRSATLADLPELRRFEQGVVEAERPFSPHLRPGPANYYDLEGLLDNSDSEIIVAEAGEKLVACGYARIETQEPYFTPDQICYLGFLYVEPEYRGMGLISHVFDALAEWSQTLGVKDFKLDVYPDNESAVRAYEKLGFKANMLEMRSSR